MMRILGIGNALTDYLFRLETDETLDQLKLPKGSMQLIDRQHAGFIFKAIGTNAEQITAGGSAANTIHGLSGLGIETGFIGKVGQDEISEIFHQSLIRSNINPILHRSDNESGFAIAFISPDGERTFATYLGAAVELTASDLREEDFEDYDLLHVEGYLVQNHQLIKKAAEMAKENGLSISIDLASFNVVNENKGFLKEFIEDYADIVFANEEEAKAYTGLESEKALKEIGKQCDYAIVKLGSHGSLVYHSGKIDQIGIYPATCIDTTGAGDLYASGFLYGLSKNLSVRNCGEIGALMAGHVVEELGAKISSEKWPLLKDMLRLYQEE